MDKEQVRALSRGSWRVTSVLYQEPGRFRAWCSPKGSSDLHWFDAPTEQGARALAQDECDTQNTAQELADARARVLEYG